MSKPNCRLFKSGYPITKSSYPEAKSGYREAMRGVARPGPGFRIQYAKAQLVRYSPNMEVNIFKTWLTKSVPAPTQKACTQARVEMVRWYCTGGGNSRGRRMFYRAPSVTFQPATEPRLEIAVQFPRKHPRAKQNQETEERPPGMPVGREVKQTVRKTIGLFDRDNEKRKTNGAG